MQSIARRAAVPVFTFTLFSSAALIFVLQPLFARITTPLLGGSPAVWNASMAFFQAALLIGYLYAHLLARLKDLRLQAGLHAGVLLLAALALPVHISGTLGAPSSEFPALWLVGVLTVSVGAPFAAVSATAPLLQSWYARSGRPDAGNPYYLYAASNLGSLIGLLSYPALIEPLLSVSAQSRAWQTGYWFVVILILLAAATALLANGPLKGFAEAHAVSPSPGWRRRLYWMGAAAAPSALVLGVTLHISTDIASAPLFWVVPLALYLVTFIIAFSRGAERITPAAVFIYPLSLLLLVASYSSLTNWVAMLSGNLAGFFMSALLCHLALARTRPDADRLTEFYFFVSLGGVLGGAFAAFIAPVVFNNVYEYPLALAAAALFLPRGKAGTARLGDFSAAAAVMMALVAVLLTWFKPADTILIAGAVGSAAALAAAGRLGEERTPLARYAFLISAAAPAALTIYAAFASHHVIFTYVEDGISRTGMYAPWVLIIPPISLLALIFIIHDAMRPGRKSSIASNSAAGIAVPALALLLCLPFMNEWLDERILIVAGLGTCVAALFLNRTRPAVVARLVLISFVFIFIDEGHRSGRIITQERGFFGVLRTRVIYDPQDPKTPLLRILIHGNTIHGAQLADPELSQQPLTYYNSRTALGEAIIAGLSTGNPGSVALIGLGAGSSACLLRPTDRLTIFEIDPAVVRLSARPGGDFTYVQQCQPRARIVLGDARRQIAREPDGAFDVIVVDAFSSDAIPVHLLTREAIALYLRKTSERGIVVLHLSKLNLALVAESARVVRDLGVPALFRVSKDFKHPYASLYGGMGTSAMIVVKSPQILTRLPLSVMPDWRVLKAPAGRAWSDDYINIARALWENLNGEEGRLIYP